MEWGFGRKNQLLRANDAKFAHFVTHHPHSLNFRPVSLLANPLN